MLSKVHERVIHDNIYRVDKKNVSKFQLRYLRHYALLLAEISHSSTNIMLPSFTVNYTIVALLIFPLHQKQNTKSKTAMPHSPDAMAPDSDTE
jgi:hypothetical protein